MALSYLFDPNKQFQDKNGVNNVYGHLEVFIDNSDDHAPTYRNFTGTFNPERIVLDNNGRAVVIVDELKTYRIEVYDRSGNMLWSQYPVRPTNVNYGDNNIFNYNADIYGTPDEIDVDVETSASGVKTFTIKLANAVKTVIGNIQSTISSIVETISTKKDKQQPYSVSGNSTKTVKSVSQNANGNISVEFENIEFPEQAPNVNITSPNNTIEIQSSTEGGVKTFEIDVKGSNLEYYRSFTHDIIPVSKTGSGSFALKDYIRKSDGTLDISQKFSAGNYLVVGEFNAIPTEVKNLDVTLGIYTHQGYQQVMVDCSKPIVPNQSQENVGTHFTIASFINIPSGYEVIPDFRIQYQSNDSTTINVECWDFSVIKLDGILSGQGGGGTEYTEGEGIKIENDEISVDYGSGLEVDPQTNKLKVKIGNGLKFNEESLEVEIDSDVEDVVETVEKLTDDLDKKITTTYPFAQITTQGDFAVFGVTNTSRMIGQLFAVPIASEIRKNETMICVNALQSFNGKVSFGIFEYDFEGNNGSGSTYWVADTGVVNVVAGENEFPLKYVDQDVHELKSSMLYYAVVAIAGDAPASGLFLAAAPNYAATYNANPKYTLLVSNMDQYIDWTTGTLQGAWFQGYNEDNTIPRLFMMLRNGEATPPIPVTEPFNDIGNFTLEHVNRVSNVFSLTPDSNGGIFRKVIPQQDVDIVSFRYVDYHGSVNQDPSTPVILDETYTPLKQVTDGSWTLGNSDQTKIDGTHYVHEFTLSTPIHLTANTPYWFLVGGNLSNQGNDWIINYQSPSVYNDLLLAKNLYNVNPYIVGNGYGEYQSSVRGMYLRLSDGTNTWVI